MIVFRSEESNPGDRGKVFGAAWSEQIARNVDCYRRLLTHEGQWPWSTITDHCGGFFKSIANFSPALAAEIEGLAMGANLPLDDIVALNARTELIALTGGLPLQECSVAAYLPADGDDAFAIQTWDWLSSLADGWLLWEIRMPDGHVVRTLTEFGIVGKIGVNNVGVGVLINILSHQTDGANPAGLPVHVAARAILDERRDLNEVFQRISAKPFCSSSAITCIACDGQDVSGVTLEISPRGPSYCLPSEDGLLVHTNHFLTPDLSTGDRARLLGPSSYMRYEQLRRRLRNKPTADNALAILRGHVGGPHALCSHPNQNRPAAEQSETLATIRLGIRDGSISALKGGPCGNDDWVCLGC